METSRRLRANFKSALSQLQVESEFRREANDPMSTKRLKNNENFYEFYEFYETWKWKFQPNFPTGISLITAVILPNNSRLKIW